MSEAEEKVKRLSDIRPKNISIGSNSKITLADIKHFCDFSESTVTLDKNSLEKMKISQRFFSSYLDKRVPIYGANTQFGDQVRLMEGNLKGDTNTYYQSITERQQNLIKSHTCGMGDAVPREVVKVAMLLRAHCLSQGYSGVSPEVVETIISCVNAGIVPRVPKYGSIGASGDLIPLATIAAALIGQDVTVEYQNRTMSAQQAFQLANIKPLNVQNRDGLALINGTSFMTAIASVSLCALERLFKQLLTSIAITLEALMVIDTAYHPLVHQLKRQKGQQEVNQFFLDFWQGSQLITHLGKLEAEIGHDDFGSNRAIQDYYSLRAVAQGFGPFNENLETAIAWVENEVNSLNDNPIMDISGNQLLNNANFMGYYVTDACDILKMNIAQASTWVHALLANLVHPRKNHNLPGNLVENPLTQNGFRPIQLLAASLAVQNRKLAQSQQAYSLPTEGDNQDVNSLGTHAAFDFREAVINLERLTAILLLAGVQALEFRGTEKASPKAQNIHRIIRQYSPTIRQCRPLQDELELVVDLLRTEKIH